MACIRCGRGTYKGAAVCSECRKRKTNREHCRRTRPRRERYTECYVCGSADNVRPFVGLCDEHYKEMRRRKYGGKDDLHPVRDTGEGG